ncbi:hypothetical protein SEA_BUD_36 [Mycobacterium phage Bud]|nr:hypothetical protein SEA_SNAPE_36 [Mycobacterium phage Snape]QBI98502.1 hypothetical protein SEA_BUD_36 [Mycobacterium phage Bud]QFG05015.1 hypothetical protein SEA_HUTC2_36 [Mycobacterium phage Hutc2]QPX61962.1 membrane protein [Mycobacterium phage Flaverint]
MKTIVALLLLVAFVLGLTACDGGASTGGGGDYSPSVIFMPMPNGTLFPMIV